MQAKGKQVVTLIADAIIIALNSTTTSNGLMPFFDMEEAFEYSFVYCCKKRMPIFQSKKCHCTVVRERI
jgi:hypothetical protein